jgi:dienelactone hydrolase
VPVATKLTAMTITAGIMAATLVATGASGVTAQEEARVITGVIDGAQYRVELPPNWNGTLLLYSHGAYPRDYIPEEIELANRKESKPVLLKQGYALAGSLYSKPYGFSAREAVHDQGALLSWFDRNVGKPRRTLAWGASAGGLNSVLLAEQDRRIDGVLAMCGPLAGAPATFDAFLDLGFTVRTLLAPELAVVGIRDPAANAAKAREVIAAALQTPSGRARLALANAYAGLPGWSTVFQPRSADVTEQIRQQTSYAMGYADFIWGDLRSDLEAQVGGNPNGNTDVDYRDLLSRASERPLVEQAYRDAGLDLAADLDKLAAAPRVAADPGARENLGGYSTPTGRGKAPVLTLHPVGDSIAAGHERTYAPRVEPSRLRQLFVNRAGHCQHTAAEEMTALGVLGVRVHTGRWLTTDPHVLNAVAGTFGPEFDNLFDWVNNQAGAVQPSFVRYQPKPLPR